MAPLERADQLINVASKDKNFHALTILCRYLLDRFVFYHLQPFSFDAEREKAFEHFLQFSNFFPPSR